MRAVYAVECQDNYTRAKWQVLAFQKTLKEARAYVKRREDSYPNAKHRVARYRKEKGYLCKK